MEKSDKMVKIVVETFGEDTWINCSVTCPIKKIGMKSVLCVACLHCYIVTQLARELDHVPGEQKP